jgi:hypothetical protein
MSAKSKNRAGEFCPRHGFSRGKNYGTIFCMQLLASVRIQLDMSAARKGNTMKTLKKLLYCLFVQRSLQSEPDGRSIVAGIRWFGDFRRWE